MAKQRAGSECTSCGRRLSINDKSRNAGSGLCWQCFLGSTSGEAVRARAVAEPTASMVTPMPGADVLRSASEFFLSRGRWQVVHQTETQLTLQHFAGGSCLVGLFLLLLGIVPGMLYLLLAKGESRLVVRASGSEDGTSVDISWMGTNWRALAWAFLETLSPVAEPAPD